MEGSTEFATPTGIQWHGTTGIVEYGQDKGLVVRFYYRPIHNPAKSVEAGRPVYDDKVYVIYHAPGERLNINDREATDEHKRRWPQQWALFQQNKMQIPDGVPVDLLFPESVAIPAMLKASSVFTIEQLGALSGDAMESVGMGAQTWVNRAQKYLQAANKGVAASKLQAELAERDSKIRTLEHQIGLMKDEMARLASDKRASNNAASTGDDIDSIAERVAQKLARPVIPPSQELKGEAFDAQSAQINATQKATRGKPGMKKKAA